MSKLFEFTADSDILVSATALRKELRCPICLDLFRKCVATKSCLHRFCSDCIVEALRKSNHECPICRTKLATKRETHEQTHIDKLIKRLYPQHADSARSPTTSRSGNEGESETEISTASRSTSRRGTQVAACENEPFDCSPAEDSLDSATNQSNPNSTSNQNDSTAASNAKRKRGGNEDETDGVSTSQKRSRANALSNEAASASGANAKQSAGSKPVNDTALLGTIDPNLEVQVILNPLVKDVAATTVPTTPSELPTRNLRTNAYATVMHVDFYLQRFRAPLEDATARDVGTRIAKSKSAACFHFFVKVVDGQQASASKSSNAEAFRLERVESSLTLRGLIARYASRWNSLQCSCSTESQLVYAGLKPIDVKLTAAADGASTQTQILPHIDLWYRERERDCNSPAS